MFDIRKLMQKVPDYKRFLTVDEMYARAAEVAQQHPDLARLTITGQSTDGTDIPMVTIGNGPKSLVLFALPHPNEPIGAMLVQFLLDELIANEQLRDGYTWHLLPGVDPDGTRLNEGWFSGPFTVENYARHFYRPRSAEQVEWTFPLSYKTYEWNDPIPETRALMAALDQAKPDFVYSLHNAGFGGVYYYMTPFVEGAYQDLVDIPQEHGLFMSLGEPEMPWAVEFAPAVYEMVSITKAYDYAEQYGEGDPATHIRGGASSYDYLRDRNPAFLVTELPYFQASQIADQSHISETRREVVLAGIDRDAELYGVQQQILDRVRPYMTRDTRFYRAVSSFAEAGPQGLESKRQWAEKAEGMDVPATVAQRADELYVGVFYKLVIASMLVRAIDAQLEETPAIAELESAKADLQEHLQGWIRIIDENLDYSPIPIRTLVAVQYGAMLAVLDNL